MRNEKIYPNREEAINAIRQFMDYLYDLEQDFGVSLAEGDSSAWYTVRYYTEKGDVKSLYYN